MSSQEYLQGLMRGETDDVALKFKLLTFDVYRADVYRAQKFGNVLWQKEHLCNDIEVNHLHKGGY